MTSEDFSGGTEEAVRACLKIDHGLHEISVVRHHHTQSLEATPLTQLPEGAVDRDLERIVSILQGAGYQLPWEGAGNRVFHVGMTGQHDLLTPMVIL
jgi:hypothetical protein